LHHTRVAKNATTCLFASHLGYAYGVGNKSMAPSRCARTSLAILALSTLITFLKGGMPAQRIAFFRAAKKQIYIH